MIQQEYSSMKYKALQLGVAKNYFAQGEDRWGGGGGEEQEFRMKKLGT